MNRVLVAGATGYLGRFVAKEFKDRDDWVRVLARQPDKLMTPGPFLEPAIDELVEVAVRALSPGVNDPFTVISCIHRLGAVLCTLAEKVIPSPYRHDEDGRLGVVTDAPPPSGASP